MSKEDDIAKRKLEDFILLDFPSAKERLDDGEDKELIDLQMRMSYLFFFKNFLTTKYTIECFLVAQPHEFLDFITMKFGVDIIENKKQQIEQVLDRITKK